MQNLRKIEVMAGVWWVEAPAIDVRILCGCPADVVKHLMKKGFITPLEREGVRFESGPNMILLADTLVQNGVFANMGEFPVLQMLYRQGMIVPGHPGNTGAKPLIMGSTEQVRAQLHYIHRGNYGLIHEEEMIAAGASPTEARDLMRLKRRFAFGEIRAADVLFDTMEISSAPVLIRDGLSVRRQARDRFEFRLDGETVAVDLTLPPFVVYPCAYDLPFRQVSRERFAVVHCGEGDGWDRDRPAMGSIVMAEGRIYLIDAGPNIATTLEALGISVDEIAGIFQTHCHDDHFAGLVTLIRADHRIRFYATALVRESVARKMGALLSADHRHFADYFDCRDLTSEDWNPVDGFEIRPIPSPHPVETTVFLFRSQGPEGYRSYAHWADICGKDVLRSYVTEDPDAPGLSSEACRRIERALAIPADLKKVDVGGGLIHGMAEDFRDDVSGRIVLAHTNGPLSDRQKEIGAVAAFGQTDVLIPSGRDYLGDAARVMIAGYLPGAPDSDIRSWLNTPLVSIPPGTWLIRAEEPPADIFLLLSGQVRVHHRDLSHDDMASVGAVIGGIAALTEAKDGGMADYRSVGYVRALRIPADQFRRVVERNGLAPEILRLDRNRSALRRMDLFRDVVSCATMTRLAREMRHYSLAQGQWLPQEGEGIAAVQEGRLIHVSRCGRVDAAEDGESLIGRFSSFRAESVCRCFLIPRSVAEDVPAVRWKMRERQRIHRARRIPLSVLPVS